MANTLLTDRNSSLRGLPETKIGDLEHVKILAAGAFGIVSLRRKGEEELVHKELAGTDELSNRLFVKEVKLLASVRHENIVRFHSICYGSLIGLEDDTCGILTEYVRFDFKPFGIVQNVSSLQGFLQCIDKYGFQGECKALENVNHIIAHDICKGLAHLHGHDIAHRDLKPDNVLVSNQHCSGGNICSSRPIVAKLTDFGESRSLLIQTEAPKAATADVLRGTSLYLAPEIVCHDGKNMDITDLKATDMWSYAMILFVLLNPDVQHPYLLDVNECIPVLGRLFDDEKLPTHGDKYLNLRDTIWQPLMKIHLRCAQFKKLKRPTSDEVLRKFEGTEGVLKVDFRPMLPLKDRKLRSQRWRNPAEWDFKIMAMERYLPLNSFRMAAKIIRSGELESKIRLEDYRVLKDFRSGQNRLQMLWIGHATLLVQMGGKNILTDPVFSDVAGPNRLMGYKRFRVPAVTIDVLKEKGIQIHVVVISHNHFDHLDEVSIKALNEHYERIKWCVPMDLKATLTLWGCPAENVKEYEWWEEAEIDDLTIRFTPAKHWSGRGMFDWYDTLWGSWIIKTKELTFFFAGDTGYQKELFDAIKQEFPSIDVAALPIGVYEPREMMECQHINPEEAVKIHKDLGIGLSVGIGWGTFQLSTETMMQTKEDLAAAKQFYQVDASTFITLEESLIMRYPREAEALKEAEAPKEAEASQ